MSKRANELKMFFKADAYVKMLSKKSVKSLSSDSFIDVNIGYYSISKAIYRSNFNELLVNFTLRKDIQEVKDKLERYINKVHDE